MLKGELPSPVSPPSGCRFRTRCRFVQPLCGEKEPPWRETAPGHWSACHFAGELPIMSGAELHPVKLGRHAAQPEGGRDEQAHPRGHRLAPAAGGAGDRARHLRRVRPPATGAGRSGGGDRRRDRHRRAHRADPPDAGPRPAALAAISALARRRGAGRPLDLAHHRPAGDRRGAAAVAQHAAHRGLRADPRHQHRGAAGDSRRHPCRRAGRPLRHQHRLARRRRAELLGRHDPGGLLRPESRLVSHHRRRLAHRGPGARAVARRAAGDRARAPRASPRSPGSCAAR